MLNEKLCKKLLEVILDIEIYRIEYPEEQKAIDISADAKSVRLDVYVKDDKNTIYNVEMQVTDPKNLPKRSRYYQGMIDLNLIEKGADYNELSKSFIIFICLSDIFKRNRHIYTFKNICVEDKELELCDETVKVFLNPNSDRDDVDEELKNFLLYIAGGQPADDFTNELEDEVKKVKENKNWRREYMTLIMRDKENIQKGIKEGIELEKRTTVIKMLKKGFDMDIISELSGLSHEEIEKLREECLAEI